MNGTIFMFPNRVEKKQKQKRNQFVALDVDSVALRHTMVYVWETLKRDADILTNTVKKC